jgi:predicted acylesterase/phospholipase RssA
MARFDIVFEGGGAKGSVFAGAMEEFYAAGHRPARLVGTSAGAITATFIAAGYQPHEMLAAVNEKQDGKPRFACFMDVPNAVYLDGDVRESSQLMSILKAVNVPGMPDRIERWVDDSLLHALLKTSPHFRQIFSLVELGGLFGGEAFCQWLIEKLGAKGVAEKCTLAELHEEKGCDLSVLATDASNQEMLILNHRTAPQVPVVMAVRMSMSIPFVWCEIEWKAEWGRYLGTDKAGARIVDGGVLSNFAIDLVATENARAKRFMGEDTDATEALNLGLLIDETLPVAGFEGRPVRTNPLKTIRRVQRLVDTMTGARDNASIVEFQDQVCRLPAKGYGTTEFDMPSEKLDALVEAGRAAMRQHLAGRKDL